MLTTNAASQEMMAANAALLALKAQRDEQQRAEEDAFRAAMMAKFAEDDRIEQLNAQKRRIKVGHEALVPQTTPPSDCITHAVAAV